MIYKLAGSKDKSRLTKEIKPIEAGTWATTILTTGEFSLIDKSKKNTGLKIRTMELSNVDWMEKASCAETINQIVLSNNGLAGPKFSEYLLSIGKDEIRKTILLNKYALEGEMEDLGISDSYKSRRAWYYSIIFFTAQAVNDALQLELDIDSIKTFFLDFERQAATSRDISQNAYNYFVEQYGVNFKRFIVSDYNLQPGPADNKAIDIWGKAEHVADGGIEVSIFPNMFDKVMRQGGYEDPKTILKSWKKKDLLDCEQDRLTRTRTIHQDSGRAQVYVIRINDQKAA